VVVLGVLGALVFWLSLASSSVESATDDAEEFARLRSGDGVTATGTMTGSRERQQAARRSMVTVQCAVYTYPDRDGTSRLTGGCARDRKDLPALGSTVPVIYDPDSGVAFVDTDETAARLDRARTVAPWYQWGALALALACGSAVVWGVGRAVIRTVRRVPTA
jgi:hypothetical protein